MSRSKRSEPGRKLRHGEIVRKQKNMLLSKRLTKKKRMKVKLMATLDPELKASLRRKKAEEMNR
jgi:hypothetical protein